MYFLRDATVSCKSKQQAKLLLEILKLKGLSIGFTDDFIEENINRYGCIYFRIDESGVSQIPFHPISQISPIRCEHLIEVLCQNSDSNKISALANTVEISYPRYIYFDSNNDWRWF